MTRKLLLGRTSDQQQQRQVKISHDAILEKWAEIAINLFFARREIRARSELVHILVNRHYDPPVLTHSWVMRGLACADWTPIEGNHRGAFRALAGLCSVPHSSSG